jgi:hypothetical protein
VVYGLLSVDVILAELLSINFDADVFVNYWYKYFIGGLILFVFAIIDWKWFNFYPLEAGVFIDVSGRSREERALFV